MIGLRELKAKTKHGECPFCGGPAKRKSAAASATQKRRMKGSSDFFLTCGDVECRWTAYERTYKRDQRELSTTPRQEPGHG